MFTLVLCALTLSARHTQSDIDISQITTVGVDRTQRSFGENQLVSLHSAGAQQLVIVDEDNRVINRISAIQLNGLTVLQNLTQGMCVMALFLAVMLLIGNGHRRLVGFTVLLCGVLLITNSIALFYIKNVAFLSLNSQLVMLLVAFTIYVFFYREINRSHAQFKKNHLIAFASQSGSAFSIAKRFHGLLPNAFDLRCLSTLTPQCLNHYKNVLVIASTYGDGEPPEKAQRFVSKLHQIESFNTPIAFSVLALGDKTYQHFCAFGHNLAALFNEKGGTALTEVVEVDKMDVNAINSWWQSIARVFDLQTSNEVGFKNEYQQLIVDSNLCENAQQQHRLAHRIVLKGSQLTYQAGDLLEVVPRLNQQKCISIINRHGLDPHQLVQHNGVKRPLIDALCESDWLGETAVNAQQLVNKLKPLTPRVYSIASAANTSTNAENTNVEIFVRRHVSADGSPGLASNYLCDLSRDDTVTTQIRTHANFHLPTADLPLILIGAGTGIAPLISHLKTRHQSGSQAAHWLFFGEQYSQHDYYFKNDINLLHNKGTLSRITTHWSRQEPGYLPSKLESEQAELKRWMLNLNAVIYLCGNKQGFGESVVAQLQSIFGEHNYREWLNQNRIRIDLY